MRVVGRNLASIQGISDGQVLSTDQERIGPYNELYNLPLIRREHLLADEGSYFTAHNNQTALTLGTGTSFSATAASLVIQNLANAGNAVPRRIFPTYVRLEAGGTAYTAASAGIGIFFAITLDQSLRYSSGGTSLTIGNVNSGIQAVGNGNSVAQIYGGAVTAAAASSNVRTIVGNRLARVAVSGTALTLVNVDTLHWNFGGVENQSQTLGSAPTAAANSQSNSFNVPPICVMPGHSMLLHLWFNCTTPSAGNAFFEVGWFER